MSLTCLFSSICMYVTIKVQSNVWLGNNLSDSILFRKAVDLIQSYKFSKLYCSN